ncbi:MAG: hypothetical protein H8D80_00620 [Proteobacteria bacterium]|nr:hypothetical protein [Pseudomonadota bacterium]
MPFKDWWIWKKLTDNHGRNGYDGIRDVLKNERYTDSDIKRKYPKLSNDTIAIMRLIFHVETLQSDITNLKASLRTDSSLQTTNNTNNHRGHRGVFSIVDEDGEYIQYVKGDIVTYSNKTYIANRKIELGMGPLHENSGWKEITAEIVEGGEFN